MPYSIEDSPKFTAALSENFRICTKDNKMNPVVVVTRAAFEGDSEAQNKLRLKFAEKFNIPAGQIFMYDNYTHQADKTMEIDRKTLQILIHTLNSAVNYQKFYKDTLIKPRSPAGSSNTHDDKQTNPSESYSPKPRYPNNNNNNTTPPRQGYTNTVSKPPPKPINQLRCECSEILESDWDECPACGRPCGLSCAGCRTELKPNWMKCPKCKLPTSAPPKKNCWNPVCGKEVDSDICRNCDAYQIRPVTCCDTAIRPNFKKCPRCKKLFPGTIN